MPYDFDFSGIVNAHYALPSKDQNLASVTDRAFMGYPVDQQILEENLELFKEKRDDLYRVVDQFKPLSRLSRSQVLEYLDTFYDSLDEIVVKNKTSQQAMKMNMPK